MDLGARRDLVHVHGGDVGIEVIDLRSAPTSGRRRRATQRPLASKALMTSWELLPQGVTSKCLPLFVFPTTRAAVEAVLGPPQRVDLDSNGVGPIDAWALGFPCGLEVVLWLFKMRPDGSMIDDGAELSSFEIQSPDLDIEHVRHHLPFPIGEIWPWGCNSAPRVAAPRSVVLVRQDDNGNRFEVKSFTSRCEAQSAMREFRTAWPQAGVLDREPHAEADLKPSNRAFSGASAPRLRRAPVEHLGRSPRPSSRSAAAAGAERGDDEQRERRGRPG